MQVCARTSPSSGGNSTTPSSPQSGLRWRACRVAEFAPVYRHELRQLGICHAVRMEWHSGNIGSAAAGLWTVIVATTALIRGPAALRDWGARQRAQRRRHARKPRCGSGIPRRHGLATSS
jgi:hypothetical protein